MWSECQILFLPLGIFGSYVSLIQNKLIFGTIHRISNLTNLAVTSWAFSCLLFPGLWRFSCCVLLALTPKIWRPYVVVVRTCFPIFYFFLSFHPLLWGQERRLAVFMTSVSSTDSVVRDVYESSRICDLTCFPPETRSKCVFPQKTCVADDRLFSSSLWIRVCFTVHACIASPHTLCSQFLL